MTLFDKIVDRRLSVRRINITACGVIRESDIAADKTCEQIDMFSDISKEQEQKARLAEMYLREKQR
jgi:DNA polymerase V